MKAAVLVDRKQIVIEDRPVPSISDDQVLIKVEYSAICGSDVHSYHDLMFPAGTIMGHEFAGTIAKVGANVKERFVGQRVVARPPGLCSCNYCQNGQLALCENHFDNTIGLKIQGGFAEYVAAYPYQAVTLPEEVSVKDAAQMEPLAVSVHAVNDSGIKVGDVVMITGAGPIGLLVLQLVKAAGASKTIVVETSPRRREKAKELGADIVIDPIAQSPMDYFAANPLSIDMAFECVGREETTGYAISCCRKGAKIVLVGAVTRPIKIDQLKVIQHALTLQASMGYFVDDFHNAIKLMAAKLIDDRVKNGSLHSVSYHTILDYFPMGCYSDELENNYVGISWFSGAGARKSINSGHADIMPAYFRDMPSKFIDYVDLDAFCAVVSPMDEHGYFSTGPAAPVSTAMIKKAKHIFLEVNENMPRALSGPIVHISQVTALCENTIPLPVSPPAQLDDISLTIGNLIAEEIPSGATIQLGIGAIPDAVGMALKSKHDLGIHTEMFTDSMVELLECGAVNNSKKPIHIGRTVAAFAFGSKRVYDYIDNNPSVMMLPVDYVNDPATICQHPNFMSINSAIEVDFFGQVCAESVGTTHISGTGGQVDYVRGAVQSKGGKSFIAFSSTAKNGTISKIKPILTPGAIVTTSKNDVDYIVTEYGIAKLRGKTLSQRTKALISIAHPKFREELTFAAKKQNILI